MPKTITACVKVNNSEAELLIALGGTVGRGLRVLIDRHLNTEFRTDDTADATPPHRHRRGELIRTEFKDGAKVHVYRCVACDKEMA